MIWWIKCIFVFLLSIVFFHTLKISFIFYLLLLSILLLLSLTCYSCEDNYVFYKNLFAGLIGNTVAFAMHCSLTGKSYVVSDNSELELLLLFLLSIEIALAFPLFECWRCFQHNERNKELFEERWDDLKRLQTNIEETDILGVNSAWGNGKSFVVDYFCRENEAEYYAVKIETLAYGYNEFDRILIDKLDGLLRSQHIFSFYSLAFKQTLGNSLWGRFVYHYFCGNQFSQTSIFSGLKTELGKLPKKVLIVFEDVERVGDKESIKRLFAIAERLSGERVKIIYEYDAGQLKKSLELNRAYLEKYIPVEMNLTDISYKSMVSAVWDGMGMDDRDMNKTFIPGSMGILSTGKDLKHMIFSFVDYQYDLFGCSFDVGKILFPRAHLTIRRMEGYLGEIFHWMQEHKENRIDEETARVVVAFAFVKYFMEEAYEKLEPWKRIEELFLFQYKGEQKSLVKLGVDLWKDPGENGDHDSKRFWSRLKAQAEEDENSESQVIYTIFGYYIKDLERRIACGVYFIELPYSERVKLQKDEERRERIDRLIWNMLQCGRTELTDNRACADKFIHDVLKKPSNEWGEAFSSYCNDLYDGKVYKENESIHLFGESPVLSVTRAVSFYYHDEETWQKMCEFICGQWEEKSITMDFIQICYFTEINIAPNRMQIIKFFNTLTVDSNFNHYDPYLAFLRKYIRKLTGEGFCSGNLNNLLQDGECDLSKPKCKDPVCQCLKNEAETLRQSKMIPSEQYAADMAELAAFMEKNIEIINHPEIATRKMPNIDIESHLMYYHQGEMDYFIKQMHENPYDVNIEQRLNEQIVKSYDKGDLYPTEIRILQDKMKQWKAGMVINLP